MYIGEKTSFLCSIGYTPPRTCSVIDIKQIMIWPRQGLFLEVDRIRWEVTQLVQIVQKRFRPEVGMLAPSAFY
jgi:hypothetical protein